MSATIKTCEKCGAKNFADFKACFNCGNDTFVSEGQGQSGFKQMVDSISNKMDIAFQNTKPTNSLQENVSFASGYDEQKTVDEAASLLNNKAQEELIQKRKIGEPSEEVLSNISDKLSELTSSLRRDTESIRGVVNADIEKLDREITTLKNDNKQVLDLLVRTQKEQIEKLERELKFSNDKIANMSEGRGKDREAISFLVDEKQGLETQLLTERERFDMLVKDRERTKGLSLMNMDIPSNYVVYSGDYGNADYLDYAKKQFLKIYPKISADNNGTEDVVYYIPGEFKNPPVLILNPNVTKDYARNLKLNLITSSKEEYIQIENKPQSMIDATPQVSAIIQPTILPKVKEELEEETFSPMRDEIEREDRREENVMNKMVGSVIDSTTIIKIPDMGQIVKQDKKIRQNNSATAISAVLGVLILGGFVTLMLGFIGSYTGFEIYSSLWTIFDETFISKFAAEMNFISFFGGMSQYAKYFQYIMLAGGVFTAAAGFTYLISCNKRGLHTVLKYLFLSIAIIIDILFIVAIFVVIPADFNLSVGIGSWVKAGIDVILLVVSCLFMSVKTEKDELDGIKAKSIKV